MQDLYTKELTVGGTGSGADTAIYPQFLSALLGMKFKLVQGYKGSGEIQLAMERNEVDGICLAYDSLLRGNLARQGQLNVLLQAGLEPDPRIKDVPQALQAARSPEDRQALELFFARVDMGRPFVLPPDVPADRVAAMRTAFQVMLKDPAFLEEADKLRLRVVADLRRADDRTARRRLQDPARDRAAHHQGARARRVGYRCQQLVHRPLGIDFAAAPHDPTIPSTALSTWACHAPRAAHSQSSRPMVSQRSRPPCNWVQDR